MNRITQQTKEIWSNTKTKKIAKKRTETTIKTKQKQNKIKHKTHNLNITKQQ